MDMRDASGARDDAGADSRHSSSHTTERFEIIFEHAPLALWEYDYSVAKKKLDSVLAGGVTDLEAHLNENPRIVREIGKLIRPTAVNASAVEMYEAPSKEALIGRDVTEQGPAMLKATQRTILAVADGSRGETFSTSSLTAKGRPMEILVRWRALGDDPQDYSHILVFTLDITESSEAQRALEESEARFAAFMEHSPLGAHLYQLRDDGSLEFAGTNPAADEILGVANAQFIGMTIEEAFPPLAETGIPQAYKECAAEGATWTGQEILYDDDEIAGAFDVHAFPIGGNRMAALFLDATDRIKQEKELETYRGDLERLVAERTAELERTNRDLQAITSVVTQMIEARDPYTAGHQQRVAALARAIAESMGCDEDCIEDLFIAARLHDIGKISIPSDILNKPGKLTVAEFTLMKDHPGVGYQILASVRLRPVISNAVHQHHERLDGSGYPNGISGNGVTFEARILAVADVAEAIVSHRPYRPALGLDVALEEIQGHRATKYDGDVVDAAVALLTDGFVFEDAAY